MVERIAENFEKTMKKGFISTFILMLLEKEPCHGYKIGKKIEEHTLGVWEPPSSTLYTVLNSLDEKGLITVTEETESGRPRKIYDITPKGRDTLKIMIEKHIQIKESMNSLFTSTLGIEQDLIPHEFLKFGPFEIIFGSIKDKTLEEKIQMLEFHRYLISRKLIEFKERIEKIDKALSNLKEKQEKNKRRK